MSGLSLKLPMIPYHTMVRLLFAELMQPSATFCIYVTQIRLHSSAQSTIDSIRKLDAC